MPNYRVVIAWNVQKSYFVEAKNSEEADDKAFKDIFSSQSIEHFKEMIDMVAKEQYERGFQDGGNLCNQTFSRICDTLARN